MSQIDEELLGSFIDESTENLSAADEAFVELEQDPENLEIINRIFRPVHSMKGASAFFGLNAIKECSHHLENLLDALRKKELVVNQPIIDVLLKGTEELKTMLSNVVDEGVEMLDHESHQALIAEIVAKQKGHQPQEQDRLKDMREVVLTLLEDGKAGEKANVESIEGLLANIDDWLKECSTEELDENDPCPHLGLFEQTLKGLFEGDGCDPDGVQTLQEAMQTCEKALVSGEAKDFMESMSKEVDMLLETLGLDPLVQHQLEMGLQTLRELEPEVSEAVSSSDEKMTTETEENKAASTAEPDGAATKKDQDAGGSKTMRVPERSIDTFLAYVGELIVVQEMFNYIQKRMRSLNGDSEIAKVFYDANESFRLLSMNLQKSLMEVRKVNAGMIVKKGPRIVRDIAKEKGKDMRVEIVGGDLMIDKSLAETLDAPFTHMIRNAADHGIEMPEEPGQKKRGLHHRGDPRRWRDDPFSGGRRRGWTQLGRHTQESRGHGDRGSLRSLDGPAHRGFDFLFWNLDGRIRHGHLRSRGRHGRGEAKHRRFWGKDLRSNRGWPRFLLHRFLAQKRIDSDHRWLPGGGPW